MATLSAKGWLGKCLTGLGRYQEAQTLLLESYHGFKETSYRQRTLRALEALVILYQKWPKPDEAAEYRALLKETDEAQSQSSPSAGSHPRSSSRHRKHRLLQPQTQKLHRHSLEKVLAQLHCAPRAGIRLVQRCLVVHLLDEFSVFKLRVASR